MDVFLKNVLRKNYQKIPLPREGSQRIYTRIQCENTSWILVESSFEVQKLFIQRLKELTAIGLKVPLVKAQEDEKNFLLVEDLGDQDLEKVFFTNSEQRMKYYQQAIDQMLLLQRKARHLNWPRFTEEQLLQELLWTKTHLLDKLLNKNQPESFLQDCLKEWQNLCHQLAGSPYVPAHRDYHSRNLMVKNHTLYWIDFQSAGLFPCCYDAVSLIYDPYIDMPEKEKNILIEYLIGVCKDSNSKVGTNLQKSASTEFSKEMWHLCVVQRLFKACGSFASFYNLKKQNSHLKYLKPALKQLVMCLDRVQKFPRFLQLVKELKIQIETDEEIKKIHE